MGFLEKKNIVTWDFGSEEGNLTMQTTPQNTIQTNLG
jgi:hypothetical protein